MSNPMDPYTRERALEQRLIDVKKLRRSIIPHTTPELDDIRRQLGQERQQLEAEIQQLERHSDVYDALDYIHELRDCEWETHMGAVTEKFDWEFDLDNLIACANRTDLEIAIHQTINAKLDDIRSIAFHLNLSLSSLDRMVDTDLMPSREALEATATRLGRALARLPRLGVVGVRFSTESDYDYAGYMHLLECFSIVFGSCRQYSKVIYDLKDVADENGLQFIMGGGSRFHGHNGSIDAIIYAYYFCDLRPILRALLTFPKLASVIFQDTDAIIKVETAEDAELLRKVLRRRSLSEVVLYGFTFEGREEADIFCDGFAGTFFSRLTLLDVYIDCPFGEQFAQAIISAPSLTDLSIKIVGCELDVDPVFYRAIGRLLASDDARHIRAVRFLGGGGMSDTYALAMSGNAQQWKCATFSLHIDGTDNFGEIEYPDESFIECLGEYLRHTEHLTTFEFRFLAEDRHLRRGATPIAPMSLVEAAWNGTGSLRTFDVLDSNMFDETWVAALNNAIAYNAGRLEQVHRPFCQAVDNLPSGSIRQLGLAKALASTGAHEEQSVALYWMLRSDESNCRSNLVEEILSVLPTSSETTLSTDVGTAENNAVRAENDHRSSHSVASEMAQGRTKRVRTG